MLVGIFSDLHLEHWRKPWDFHTDDYPDVDVWINAGDTASLLIRNRFNSLFKDKTYLSIFGNHDYYGLNMEVAEPAIFCGQFYPKGISIAVATMWTDLSNPVDWAYYANGLIDCRKMYNWTQKTYMSHYNMQSEYLLKSGADIIVSHHAPSYQSVGPQYKGDPCSPGFCTELSDKILALPKPPKLWIHGHMHNESDYMIGNTRVICHPRGYPSEGNVDYKPLFIDI